MLPDSKLGTDGFHDVLIDNLATSPSWRSSHISPADVTALRRRWLKAVFRTMQATGEGSGAPPQRCSSSIGPGISTQCAGVLPHM